MKRRHEFALIYGFAGIYVALGVAILALALVVGFGLLLAPGAGSWPETIRWSAIGLLIGCFVCVWGRCVRAGYVRGKSLERAD